MDLSSYDAALHIKKTLKRTREEECNYSEARDIFRKPELGNIKRIKYSEIVSSADKELDNWLCLPKENITKESTFENNMQNWLETQSPEDLSEIFNIIHQGSNGIKFTPWQRLFMYFICKRPFGSTTSLSISSSQLEDIQRKFSGNKRRIELNAQYSCQKGSTQRVTIIPLATASGKTSITISICDLLMTVFFEKLVTDYNNRCNGTVMQGPEIKIVPRLVIICGSGGVHSHWVNEFKRLQEEFKKKQPNLNYQIWDGQSKKHSTLLANSANTVTFWFLQISKMNEELRKHPNICVPIVVTDEMTVDTPREQSVTCQSDVIVRLLPQATPQALVRATSGRTSWLKREFDGEIIGPCYMKRFMDRNDFKHIQTCMNHYCRLSELMPLGFRHQIRSDLLSLIPDGMDVIHIKSKRGSVASYLTNDSADIVPTSFKNVVLSKLPYHDIDRDSDEFKKLESTLSDEAFVTTESIATCLENIKSKTTQISIARNSDISRMIERIQEFTDECPICCTTGCSARMMSCCSYCVCSTCYTSFSNKCAFCRTSIKDVVNIPLPPEERDTYVKQQYVSDTIFFNTSSSNMQMKNLKVVLQSLKDHGHNRIILLVNVQRLTGESKYTFTQNVQEDLDMKVYDTEYSTSGKGTGFKSIKERFDDMENTETIVLLCNNSHYTSVGVGVNFNTANAVVIVGELDPEVGHQILGRVFRPNPNRASNYFIPFVKIYS